MTATSNFICVLINFPGNTKGKIHTPDTCKDVENLKICALVRNEKKCLKKKQRPKSGIVKNMTVTIQEPRIFPAWTMVISISGPQYLHANMV
jgi:hypothetical protein